MERYHDIIQKINQIETGIYHGQDIKKKIHKKHWAVYHINGNRQHP